MNILELFSGTCIFSANASSRGHNVMSVDIVDRSQWAGHPTHMNDIRSISPQSVRTWFNGEKVNLIWASPDCKCYSVAGFHHQHFNLPSTQPLTDQAKESEELIRHMIWLIQEIDPDFYFIENPRGLLRKMPFMRAFPRTTITYCQYGDSRMKPTDIWGRWPRTWAPRPMCNNGDDCHEPGPRGSWKTGTNALDYEGRIALPLGLVTDVLLSLETSSDKESWVTLHKWIQEDQVPRVLWPRPIEHAK